MSVLAAILLRIPNPLNTLKNILPVRSTWKSSCHRPVRLKYHSTTWLQRTREKLTSSTYNCFTFKGRKAGSNNFSYNLALDLILINKKLESLTLLKSNYISNFLSSHIWVVKYWYLFFLTGFKSLIKSLSFVVIMEWIFMKNKTLLIIRDGIFP